MRNSFLSTVYSSIVASVDISNACPERELLKTCLVHRLISTAAKEEASVAFVPRLIEIAERARTLRNTETLRDASVMLMDLPSRTARHVGLYYFGVTNQRLGNRDAARNLFERVACTGLTTYQARGLQSLGFLSFRDGDLNEANKFFLESIRASSHRDFLTKVFAEQAISSVKGASGDHQYALRDLTRLSTAYVEIAKLHPVHWYIYQASLAFELTQVGRLEEAERALNIALASPFAPAFPEWLETRDEIQARREATPVFVAVESSSLSKFLPPSSETRPEAQPRLPESSEVALNIPLTTVTAEVDVRPAQPSLFASGAHHLQLALPVFIVTSAHRGAAARRVTQSRLRSMPHRNIGISRVPDNRRPRSPPTIYNLHTIR